MSYEKIELTINNETKEYDLISEYNLNNTDYVIFTEDATKEEMDIYCMKIDTDGSLINVSKEEEDEIKKLFDGGALSE